MAALVMFTGAAIASALATQSDDQTLIRAGINPHPVHLMRPASAPLSAMARLGRAIFFDPRLSSSGKISCASCHSPAFAYAAPSTQAVMRAGPHLESEGLRAVPSLMYLERQPAFSIGADANETDAPTPLPIPANASQLARKTAADPTQAQSNLVPQGGLFWDGRVDTLQRQAHEPLLDPTEMDGGSDERVATKLRSAAYAPLMRELFGPTIFARPEAAVAQALFALARYQIEDPSFHRYASTFDAWLEGKARLTPSEARGYQAFNDPQRGNCAACHLDRPTPEGYPPLFTDHQFEALGIPRNVMLARNHDPEFYDLGLCGPKRMDLRTQARYCGFFLTPTLRNVATRAVFFHNGVYRSLHAVLDFYTYRDIAPQRTVPKNQSAVTSPAADLPSADFENIDRTDPPLDRSPGSPPALSPQDEADIIAFLGTLTDRGFSGRQSLR
jgi:cytochrome c peroxidase